MPVPLRSPGLCLFFALCAAASAEETARTWTDQSGRSFSGVYLSATADKVSIRRGDGRVFDVERTKLSQPDQDYLAGKTRPASAALPEKTPRHLREMLAGYDGSAPNFDAGWPANAGIDQEPPITVVEENAAENRFIYESPHFRFQSNVVLRPSLLSKVATMFEACFQLHHDLPLNNRRTRSPKAAKLKAHLLETTEQYHAAGGLPGTSGVYLSDKDEFLVPLTCLGVQKVGSGYMFDYRGDFHTMYHEITHQLWADLDDYAGIWMVEGLAEFIACAPYSNGRFSFTKQPGYALEYATGYGKKNQGGRALGEDLVMPKLRELMTMSQAKFYSDANRNYGFGLLLVYYFILLDGQGDGARFKDCVKARQDGKSAEEARQALLAGRSYEDLEKEVAAAFRRKGIKIRFVES